MRLPKVVVTATTVLVVSLLAGAPTSPSTSQAGGKGRASAEAQKIRRFATAQFPTSFAGVAIASDQQTVIVYRRPAAGFDRRVRSEFPNAMIKFIDVRRSQAELMALAQGIVDDIPYWRARGVRITEVAPEPARSAVVVGVETNVRSARRALEAHYPHDDIQVHGRAAALLAPFRRHDLPSPP